MAIIKALSEEWGADAVQTEIAENKAYIRLADEFVITLIVDCSLGVVHGQAELTNAFPPSMAPKTFEDQCICANRLNIMLSRELGVTNCFQVLNDTLTLTDTRVFEGPGEIVNVCDTLAQDNIALARGVTQSLSLSAGHPVPTLHDAPNQALSA